MEIHTEKKEVNVSPEMAKEFVIENKVYAAAFDWKLTEKDLEQARVELGETEEKKQMLVQALREKLSKDEEVRYKTDDDYLIRFLRVRKYDLEKAYKNIKLFYSLRGRLSKLFTIPPNFESLLEFRFVTHNPCRDEEGRIVMMLHADNWNLEELSCENALKVCMAALEIATANPRMQIEGVFGIWDSNGLTLRHMAEILKCDPFSLIAVAQSYLPWRVKKLLIVNAGRIPRIMYNIVRNVLSKKLKERIVMLGSDMTELHQYINPVHLPKKFGGSLDLEECNMTKLIMDNLDYLEYERSFR